jgi:hypothetical protein
VRWRTPPTRERACSPLGTAGFEPQRSPVRLAGIIDDLERIEGDRVAIVVRADRALPAGGDWGRVAPRVGYA